MVTAAQLVGRVAIEGDDSARSKLQAVSKAVDATQHDLGSKLVAASKSAGGGFLDFASKASMAGMGVVALAKGAAGLATAMFKPAASMEQAAVSFKAFLGSGEAVQGLLKDLSKFSAQTPFEFPEIQQTALKLLNMGVASKDVTTYMQKLGDAVSKVGGTGVMLEEVTGIIGQMGMKGKISNEEMMQLTERNIPAYKLLGEAMGVPVDSLQDMISRGEVGKEKIDLLVDSMGKFGSGAMVEQSKTFNGILSTLKDNAQLALVAFAGPLMEQAKDGLKGLADKLSTPAFQNFATGVGKQIGDAFKSISDFVTPLAPQFLKIAENFGKLGEAFNNPAFQKLSTDIGGDLKAGLTWLINALASPEFGAFMKTVGEGMATAIKFVIPLVKDIAKNVVQFATDVYDRMQPLIKWWNENWPQTANILKGVWDEIVGVVKIAWALVSGIIKIGLDILSGDWGKAWEDFKTMLSGVWDGLKQIIKGGIEIMVGLFRPLLEAMSQIPGPAGDMAKGVLEKFDVMRTGARDKTTQMKLDTLEQTRLMHVGAVDNLEKMKQDLIKKISETTDPVKRKALEMQLGVTAETQKMHINAANKAEEMKKDVTKSAKGMSNEMVGHSIIPNMVNGVIAWFGRMSSGAMGAIASLPGRLAGFWNMLVANATSAGANIVNGIANGIRGAIGAVGSAMASVAKYISDHLPHSPAKIGPLRYLVDQGEEITNQVAKGILAGTPVLSDVLSRGLNANVAASISGPSINPSVSKPAVGPIMPASFRSGSNASPVINHIKIYVDGKELSDHTASHMIKAARSSGPIRS